MCLVEHNLKKHFILILLHIYFNYYIVLYVDYNKSDEGKRFCFGHIGISIFI